MGSRSGVGGQIPARGFARVVLPSVAALGLGVGVPVVDVGRAAAAGRAPVVVALGDSVPAGAHCGCANFVQQYADRIGAATGASVHVQNLAEDGATSADLVELMRTGQARAAVAQATAVVVMAGANDYDEAFEAVGAGAAPAQYRRTAARVRANISTVLRSIHSINPGADVVVADYWAAMEDGAVAKRDYSRAQLAAAREATDSVNAVLRSVCSAGQAHLLSTWQAFRAQGADDTGLLAPDGDHPNAAGTSLIARALVGVLPRG